MKTDDNEEIKENNYEHTSKIIPKITLFDKIKDHLS